MTNLPFVLNCGTTLVSDYWLSVTLFLFPVSRAEKLELCTPARQSTTLSCPSSLGPSLRMVSHNLDLPAERKKERMWVGV